MASAASIEAVQQAYIAYYGRPADPAGLDFWASRLDDEGGDITSMIQAFGTSTEATELYGSGALNVTRAVTAIDNIYNQVFGRDADDEGESFYVTKLLSGEFTFVDVAQRVLDGATGTDAALIANKTLAAQSFTDALAADDVAAAGYVGTAAAQGAKTWLAQVDETLDSIVAAEANITETVQANGNYTYTYSEAVALYNAGTLPATFSISDEAVDLGTLAIGDVTGAVDEATAVLLLASNATEFNSDNVTYALEDSTVAGGELTVAGAVAGLADVARAIAAASNGDEVTITVTYSLNDTLANLVAADASVISGASSYSLSSTAFTFDAGAVTVAGQAAAVAALGFAAAEQAIVDGAANADDVSTQTSYTYADTLVNLAGATLDVAYALTDAAGGLGGLTGAQVAIVQGATNAADYSFGTIYTLTTSTTTTDSIVPTANGDTFDATTLNSLQTNDLVLDATTGDGDVLNALLTTTTQAPRLTNVEAINITARFNAAGLALTNVTGTDEITANSSISNGVISFTDVNSLAVDQITFGSKVEGVNLASLSSGTRDYVSVNLGGASGSVTLVSGGADFYNFTMGSGSNVVLISSGANDDIIVNNEDTSAITITGDTALEALTVNASGDLTISVGTGLSSATTVVGGGTVTVDLGSGASTLMAEMTLTGDGTETLILNAGSAVTADLSNVEADYVVIDNVDPGSAATVTLSTVSTLQIQADLGTALTVTGATSGFSAIVEYSQSQSAGGVLTTTANVETLLISSTSAVTVAGINANAATTTVAITGSNDITITTATFGNGTVITSQDFTGDLTVGSAAASGAFYLGSGDDSITISAAVAATVLAGEGDDTITVAGVLTAYGEDGDDTITGGVSVDTIFGGSGADVIVGGAGNDIITLGAGSDTLRFTSSADGTDVVSDFTQGEDVIQLIRSDVSSIDVSSLGTSSGAFALGSALTVTLTGVSDTDFSDSMQLGRAITSLFDINANGGARVVAGDLADFIGISGAGEGSASTQSTVTLGGAADTLVVTLTGNASAGTAFTVTDFDTSEDLIILTGSADGFASFDMGSASVTGVTYTLGTANLMTLTGNSATDLSSVIQLGISAGSTLAVSASEITLSEVEAFLSYTSAGAVGSVLNWKEVGGIDWIDLTNTSANITFNFDELTGIGATATAVAADGSTSVADDALNGMVYVFASGASGTSSSSIDFTGGASATATQFSMTDVADFLAVNIGETSGEKYVAVINDLSGTSAYAFYVDVVGDTITEDMVTLLAQIGGNSSAITVTNIE